MRKIKTGGALAAKLEAVIVSLPAATVSDTTQFATFGEYVVTDNTDTLIVDDFLFKANPAPQNGESFTAVRGIVALRQMVSKLEPRDASDLTAGAPGLASFGPALSYARVGTTNNAPTFPQPLTVQLTAAAAADTTVVIVSNSGSLTVASVTVQAGQSSAVVPVTAVSQNANVTLTATLGVQSRQASRARARRGRGAVGRDPRAGDDRRVTGRLRADSPALVDVARARRRHVDRAVRQSTGGRHATRERADPRGSDVGDVHVRPTR